MLRTREVQIRSLPDVITVRSHDATLPHETGDTISIEHCFALFQGVATQQCRIARAGSTPPVALKMSSREGLGAMLQSCIVWIEL